MTPFGFQLLKHPKSLCHRGAKALLCKLQLDQIVHSLKCQGFLYKAELLIAGQENEQRDSPIGFRALLQDCQSAFNRHFDVGDHQVGLLFGDRFLQLFAVAGYCNYLDAKLIPREHGLQTHEYQRLVVGDDQFGCHGRPSLVSLGRRMIAFV
jgi:hypothetical protein